MQKKKLIITGVGVALALGGLAKFGMYVKSKKLQLKK